MSLAHRTLATAADEIALIIVQLTVCGHGKRAAVGQRAVRAGVRRLRWKDTL